MPTWNCQVNLSYDDGRQQRERTPHTQERERKRASPISTPHPPLSSSSSSSFFWKNKKLSSWNNTGISERARLRLRRLYLYTTAPACAMSSSIVEVPSRPVSDDMLPDRDDLWPTTRPFLLLSSVSIPPHVDAKSAPPSIPSSSSSFPLLKMRLERSRRRRKKWYKYIEGNYRSTGRALVLTHTHTRRTRLRTEGKKGEEKKWRTLFSVFGSGMLAERYIMRIKRYWIVNCPSGREENLFFLLLLLLDSIQNLASSILFCVCACVCVWINKEI